MTATNNEELVMEYQQGDQEAIGKLWLQVCRFVEVKAGDYLKQFPAEYQSMKDDLIQQSYFSLIHAADRFDPERGAPFLSYFSKCLPAAFHDVIFSGRGSRLEHDPLNNHYSLDQPLIDPYGNSYSLLDVIADDKAEEEVRKAEEDDYRRSQNEYIRACIQLASDEIGKAILTEMLEANCGYRDAVIRLYGQEAIGDERFAIHLRRRKAYAVNQIRQRSKRGVKRKLMRMYSLELKSERSGLRGYGLGSFRKRGYVSEVERIVLGDLEKESE